MVLAPQDFTPYSTAKPLLGSAPTWLQDPLEQQRVQSYSLYEQIYWNVPEAFKLSQRGQDEKPIYVPSGRQIVETLHRHLAAGLNVVVDPLFGTTADQTLALQVFNDFAARTRFYSSFNASKRYGIIRGDWAFILTGNADKAPGTKVGMESVDPGGLFPIWGGAGLDDIIGWHIVEQYMDRFAKARIYRRTYRKTTGLPGPSPIEYSADVFELDKWGGPGQKEEKVVSGEPVSVPPTVFPAPIDDLPVYTIQNFQQPGFLWGSSEMRGLESLMSHVNQSISDEELELVLSGLGVYATNAGAPIDEETGLELPWNLGPARVVEVPPEAFFNRVSGVGTVAPHQDHLKYLHQNLDQTVGHSDVAKGKVDVTVAESGVALAIQMGPLFAIAGEKEQIITDVMTNLLFNWPKWLVAYEGSAFSALVSDPLVQPGETQTGVRLVPRYGPKLPENQEKRVAALLQLLQAKAIGVNFVWSELRRMGWDLPDDTAMLQSLNETIALTAPADPFAERMDEELEGAGAASGNGQGE